MTTTAVEFDPVAALQVGIDEIKAKAPEVEKNWNYYEGDHPRIDWVEKIRKVFGDQVADQVHVTNYCEKVVNAPLARLSVEGFSDPTADELFRLNGLYLAQEDLYKDAFIADTGYVIVAEAEPGSETPYDIVVQRAEDCHVEMGSLKPHDREYGVKVWADPHLGPEGGYRAQVWDRANYWRFVSYGDPDNRPIPKAAEFEADPEDESGPHGFDKMPMIPFRKGRRPRSRVAAVRPIQDRIDMLEIEKVIAGLFGASRQRVFFTTQELADGDTEASPDFAIVLEPGNEEDGKASVTEFDYTPLSNYDEGIDAEIERLYEIADLPKHGRINPGADASGEAIKADESPFTAMLGGFTDAFGEDWQQVFDLLGIEAEVVWKDIETRNEQAQVETVKTVVDAGAPLEWALIRFAGATEDDIADLRKALAAQRAEEAAAREAAIQAMDQGRDPGEVASETYF